MVDSSKTRFATLNVIAALLLASCVDAGKSFKEFEERVIDGGGNVVVGSCNGGEIPDVNGEFYLALAPSISPDVNLLFRATATLQGDPATLTLELQPLCNTDQCTLGDPVGDPIAVAAVEVSDTCTFEASLVDGLVPGSANPISGSDIIANIDMIGSLNSDTFFCGIANGTATVSGSAIPVDGSSFGAVRIEGETLPTAVDACPEEEEVDAGV